MKTLGTPSNAAGWIFSMLLWDKSKNESSGTAGSAPDVTSEMLLCPNFRISSLGFREISFEGIFEM